MKKRLLLSLLVLFMSAATNVWAADPDNTLYEAALAAIQDDQDYYIQTNVNGTMYYVTTEGLLTSDRQQAGIFHITKTSAHADALVGTGFRIFGAVKPFTNPPLRSGNVANLSPGAFSRLTDWDRDTWERQVLYLDGNGKFAIRSSNVPYGESSYNDAGRTFWTYSTGDAVTPCYTYTPAFIWEFVKYTPGNPHIVRWAEGVENWSVQNMYTLSIATPPAELNDVLPGDKLVATYSGDRKVKSVKAVKRINPITLPLTIEALNNGTIVVSNPQSGMQYTLNGGAKTAITANPTEITVATGDKVAFYGNGTNITSYEGTQITGGTASVTAYGNIMSLLDEQNFATATTLTSNGAFYQLFQNNITLTDASGLLLPATTLTYSCYNMMFYNCSALTAAPALPATTLANKCYQNMFYGCTALTTAPELPATTLAEECYNSMFQSSGLTAAPALPATTLATRCYNAMFRSCNNLATVPSLPAAVLPEGCYMHMFRQSGLVTVPANMMASATTLGEHCCESMFRECPNLTNAPTIAATTVDDYSLNAMFYHSANVATADFTLPATTLADHCYYNMFNGCIALTSVPADMLPAGTLAESCYQNMFKGCSSLTTAPVLTATTLTNSCYAEMFNGCSSLGSVTCLATSFGSNSTYNWLNGVAATGTFTTPSSTNWQTADNSGIPSGWTREDYVEVW